MKNVIRSITIIIDLHMYITLTSNHILELLLFKTLTVHIMADCRSQLTWLNASLAANTTHRQAVKGDLNIY